MRRPPVISGMFRRPRRRPVNWEEAAPAAPPAADEWDAAPAAPPAAIGGMPLRSRRPPLISGMRLRLPPTGGPLLRPCRPRSIGGMLIRLRQLAADWRDAHPAAPPAADWGDAPSGRAARRPIGGMPRPVRAARRRFQGCRSPPVDWQVLRRPRSIREIAVRPRLPSIGSFTLRPRRPPLIGGRLPRPAAARGEARPAAPPAAQLGRAPPAPCPPPRRRRPPPAPSAG